MEVSNQLCLWSSRILTAQPVGLFLRKKKLKKNSQESPEAPSGRASELANRKVLGSTPVRKTRIFLSEYGYAWGTVSKKIHLSTEIFFASTVEIFEKNIVW